MTLTRWVTLGEYSSEVLSIWQTQHVCTNSTRLRIYTHTHSLARSGNQTSGPNGGRNPGTERGALPGLWGRATTLRNNGVKNPTFVSPATVRLTPLRRPWLSWGESPQSCGWEASTWVCRHTGPPCISAKNRQRSQSQGIPPRRAAREQTPERELYLLTWSENLFPLRAPG